jgi:hypothetical protein
MSNLTHAERVAAAVPDDCKVVALLHDAVEDGHITQDLAWSALDDTNAWALRLLTRQKGVTYAAYINRMVELRMLVPDLVQERARIVKIADLRDNLYGRPEGPPPESLRKRYEKALQTLEGTDA